MNILKGSIFSRDLKNSLTISAALSVIWNMYLSSYVF
jgi:hypothetical protein